MNAFAEESAAWDPLPPPWSECRSDGELLVTSRESMLPPRCVKCGDKAAERRTAKLYWHSPWWYLALVFGFWAYLIAALAVRQKAVVEVGLCERHARRRQRGRLAGWLLMIGGVGSLFVGHPLAIVVGTGAFSVGLILALVASRLVVPKRIEGNNVWLARVHPSIVRVLPPCV